MRVLVAPSRPDPRHGGFNYAIPGELVYKPPSCDSGQRGVCGCEDSWVGVTSHKATTTAEVVDLDVTEDTYLRLIAAALIEDHDYDSDDAAEHARSLADIAADFSAGALVVITPQGDDHYLVGELEV